MIQDDPKEGVLNVAAAPLARGSGVTDLRRCVDNVVHRSTVRRPKVESP